MHTIEIHTSKALAAITAAIEARCSVPGGGRVDRALTRAEWLDACAAAWDAATWPASATACAPSSTTP